MAVELDFDVSSLIPRYLTDVRENLAALEKVLLGLESSPEGEGRSDAINTLFRTAHTIKGSSWMMGYQAVGDVAHALEDVLGALRDQQVTADPALVDGLLQGVDRLRQLIDQPPDASEGVQATITGLRRLLSKQEAAPAAADDVPTIDRAPGASDDVRATATGLRQPPSAHEAVPAASKSDVAPHQESPPAQVRESPAPLPTAEPVTAPPMAEDTVRVAVSRLDELLRLAGELMMGGQRAQELEGRSFELATRVRNVLLSIANSSPEEAVSNVEAAGESRGALREAARSMADQVDAWRGEQGDGPHLLLSATKRLEQEVMALRLLPVGTLFAGLPRLVRDLARKHEKQVELVVEGEATELDRRILQGLNEPLLHLIRNAVDHGLEAPAARVTAGKPALGTITVRAYRQGGHVRVEVTDDGQGMSPQRLREVAVQKKLISAADAAALDDHAALELIYRPGFSSNTLITSTSGRGVGMEVIKSSVSKLGGAVELWTDPGRGTRFTLILPITLTLTRALLVKTNDRTYALPVGTIEHILRLSPQTMGSSAGREYFILDGEPIPLLRLGRLLGGSDGEQGDCPVLVFSVSGKRTALAVWRVLDEREVVLKPLGDLLGRSALAASVTLLADGTLVPVLDPGACVRAAQSGAQRGPAAAEPEARQPHRILVVEDAPTTRELERSILIASGYEVETATDGEQGWHKVQSGNFDLVLTDVEMPGKNGFELTETIRANERFAGLPVIIVTSLEKESEKRRGLVAGAQAYLVKSSFDQSALLETIERLLP
jgi:two-component system chemotaxis sensor kinase CheA